MLTPRFKLTQNDTHVFITIHAPYTNISDTEIDISDKNFLFVSSPYFLRLELPGALDDSDTSNVRYVADTGDFNMIFEKQNPGEHFENLDMITSLIAPRQIPDINPTLVEALEEGGVTIEAENNDVSPQINKLHGYGFANKFTTEFGHIGCEYKHLFELRTPENTPMEERFVLKKKHEARKFSSDHYLADFFETELIEPYLKVEMRWNRPEFPETIEFDDEEINVLKDLPNKNYLLTPAEYNQIMLSIVDILFGFCYDRRTTWNEGTIESGWTMNKISATFSWFCSFNDLKEVVISCYRRALIYPIFRNFILCNNIQNDVATLIGKGKTFVIKCFIYIFKVFNANQEARYVFNQLYIRDYLIFLQKCNNDEFLHLSKNLSEIEVKKSDLDLELDELEHAAHLVQSEDKGAMENSIARRLASLCLLNNDMSNFDPAEFDSDDDSEITSSSSSETSSSENFDSDEDGINGGRIQNPLSKKII